MDDPYLYVYYILVVMPYLIQRKARHAGLQCQKGREIVQLPGAEMPKQIASCRAWVDSSLMLSQG
jgi:hypothetical protein